MPPASTRTLTERQAAVMERIDRRVPIKVIAQELGVSETRINQHIRALKDIYGADNMRDLVDIYRLEQQSISEGDDARAPDENQTLSGPTPPLSEDAYNFSQLPPAIFGFDSDTRDSDATVDLNDATPLIHQAPWLKPGEPKVVPGLLDGEHALTLRLAAIVGIAFGILAAGVLTAVSATMISEAFEGHAAVPVDEHGFS